MGIRTPEAYAIPYFPTNKPHKKGVEGGIGGIGGGGKDTEKVNKTTAKSKKGIQQKDDEDALVKSTWSAGGLIKSAKVILDLQRLRYML